MGDKARLKPKAIPDPEMASMMAKENQVNARILFVVLILRFPFSVLRLLGLHPRGEDGSVP